MTIRAATGRAQRASARQQASTSAVPASDTTTGLSQMALSELQPLPNDTEFHGMAVDDDLTLSRTSSSTNVPVADPPPLPASDIKAKRKDKGKGKEIEITSSKAKEEPKLSTLLSPELSNLVCLLSAGVSPVLTPVKTAQLNNEDHCSSCRSSGALVYCDGCPKAFHLWCLDPPLQGVDEARWFCPTCVARKVMSTSILR